MSRLLNTESVLTFNNKSNHVRGHHTQVLNRTQTYWTRSESNNIIVTKSLNSHSWCESWSSYCYINDNGRLCVQNNKAKNLSTNKSKIFVSLFEFLFYVEPVFFPNNHNKCISFSFLLEHLQVQGWNDTEQNTSTV